MKYLHIFQIAIRSEVIEDVWEQQQVLMSANKKAAERVRHLPKTILKHAVFFHQNIDRRVSQCCVPLDCWSRFGQVASRYITFGRARL